MVAWRIRTPIIESLCIASNSFGISTTKEIGLHVGAGTPEIAGLMNVAGSSAPAACVSGAAAALTGNFLTNSEAFAADGSANSLELNGATFN